MKYKLIIDDKVISEQELDGDFLEFQIKTTSRQISKIGEYQKYKTNTHKEPTVEMSKEEIDNIVSGLDFLFED